MFSVMITVQVTECYMFVNGNANVPVVQ